MQEMRGKSVYSKNIIDLLNVMGEYNYVTPFINYFGNIGFVFLMGNREVSIYIEHGEYHVGIDNEYFNGLNINELIKLLQDS